MCSKWFQPTVIVSLVVLAGTALIAWGEIRSDVDNNRNQIDSYRQDIREIKSMLLEIYKDGYLSGRN